MKSLNCLFLATTAGLVAGFPFSSGRSVDRRAAQEVTQLDVNKFNLFSQWSGASYCNDDAQPGANVTCSGDVCPDLESSGAIIVGSFRDNTSTGMEGFVGVDPSRSEVVLSFRGTQSIRNWIANVDFFTDDCDDLPVPDDSDCGIHSGFNEAWNQVKDSVYTFIANASSTYPNHTLIVTGHSLGGAVGTIAAAHLRAQGYALDLYTFGSPRVGDEGFVNFVNNQEGNEFRVTHSDDPVPRLPPSSSLLGSYRHTSPEFWLTVENTTTISASAIRASNFELCEGIDNDACNAGTDGFNIDAHRFYLRNISACGPDGLQFRKY